MNLLILRQHLRLLGIACCSSLLFVVSLARAIESESSQVLEGRTTISLNGIWKFNLDPTDEGELGSRGVISPFQTADPDRVTLGEEAGFAEASFDDSDWDNLSVPGNWDLHDEYSNYFDNAWYRKTFELSPQDNKVVRLQFGAVYYQVEVWLNGTRLGHHIGGYTPFEFDISEFLAESGQNQLALRVSNLFRQGAWWPWGGISRDVNIAIDEPVYIEQQQIVAVPDLDEGTANIDIEAILVNTTDTNQSVRLSGGIRTKEGEPIADLPAQQIDLAANTESEVDLTLSLSGGDYELWDIDRPNLYFSDLKIESQDEQSDDYAISDRFGIRLIELNAGIFRLNGEAVRLIGYNRVPDDRVNGNIEPEYVVRRDLDRMKASGTNISRLHPVVQAKELIEYADEIGILLIGEVPIFSSKADISENNRQTPAEFRELVKRDFNHPCIFAWSVANETVSGTNEGRRFISNMVNLSKELDPNRPVTYARKSAGGIKATDATQFTDFASINLYGGFAGSTRKVSRLWPDRLVFVSEFSRDGFRFNTKRENLEHTSNTGTVVKDWNSQPKVLGASVWSYNDYRSEFRGTSINETRGWGVQDAWGNIKFAYKQAQDGFAPVNDLAVIPLNGEEAQAQTFITLTPRNIPELELPSFALRGYKLTWRALGRNGDVLQGQVFELPDILPGSNELSWLVSWDKSNLQQPLFSEKVTLVNPTGHEVRVANVENDFAPKPAITQVVEADGAIRVFFERQTGATSYQVEVVSGSQVFQESANRSDFIDVAGLTNDETYQVRLNAINQQGATPSIVVEATPSAELGSLPPIVQAVTPIVNGFVMGFIRENGGVSEWEVEVLDASSGQQVESYTTKTIGSSRNDRLEGNKEYAVRIRAASGGAWSLYRPVKTLGDGYEAEIDVHGVLVGDNSLAIAITPHPLATSYTLEIGGGASDRTIDVERAAVDLLVIDNLESNTEYQIKLTANTAGGASLVQSFSATTAETTFELTDLDANRLNTGATDNATSVNEIVFLDSDSEGYIEESGEWKSSRVSGRFSRSNNSEAGWDVSLQESARLRAEVRVPSASKSTKEASFTVTHRDGESVVEYNQADTSGDWVDLGVYDFEAGVTYSMRVTNLDGVLLRVNEFRLVEAVAIPTADAPDILYDWDADGDLDQDDTSSLSDAIRDEVFIDPVFDIDGNGQVNSEDVSQIEGLFSTSPQAR